MFYNPTSALEMMLAAQRQYFALLFPYLPSESRDLVPMHSIAGQSGTRTEAQTVNVQQNEQVVQVGQEVVTIDKQRVPGEATRVRRVVTAIPFEQRVELHDEVVTIERRRVAGQGDDEVVAEREFIMIDTQEIPVVNKHTVIREELVLRKKVSGRVEVIREKLRKSDVEIVQPRRTSSQPQHTAAMGENGGRNDKAHLRH